MVLNCFFHSQPAFNSLPRGVTMSGARLKKLNGGESSSEAAVLKEGGGARLKNPPQFNSRLPKKYPVPTRYGHDCFYQELYLLANGRSCGFQHTKKENFKDVCLIISLGSISFNFFLKQGKKLISESL